MIVPREIEQYCIDHSRALDPAFSAILQELDQETRAFAPENFQMQVGPQEGAFLSMVVRCTGVRRILEFGTFTGCSGLHFALALPEDGRVTTLDRDPRAVRIARYFWERAGVARKMESLVDDARISSLRIRDEIRAGHRPPYDLAFIDADKTGYEAYFEASLQCLRPGGMILVDNVLWSGRVLDPQDESDRAIHRFNERFSRDPRVESVLLPIRDGISWYRVRGVTS